MTDHLEQDVAEIVAGLSEDRKTAILEGRIHDCPYNHPVGTRCPNCSGWPFKKGGATKFIERVRAYLRTQGEQP